MPSSSKKQHRFMAAIANNPSFAKKVGVSQSVGKDFNAADKGKTFNKGGMMKMRKMKTRRFYEGGMDDDPEAQKVYSNVGRGSALGSDDNEDRYYEVTPEQKATPRAAPAAAPRAAAPRAAAAPAKPSSPAGSSTVSPEQETALQKREFETTLVKGAKKRADVENEKTRAVTSMPMRGGRVKDDEGVSRYASESLTPEQRKENAKNLAIEAVFATPMGKGAQLAYRGVQGVRAAKAAESVAAKTAKAASAPNATASAVRPSGGRILSAEELISQGPAVFRSNRGLSQATFDRLNAARTARYEGGKGATSEFIRSRRAAGYKKGGNVMESKKMVGREMAFMKKKGAPASMIKHEKAEAGMKKGGMPMKDGKPAFLKKMMGGGMAKYAKGGGIESVAKPKAR